MYRILATVATVLVVRVALDAYETSSFRKKLLSRNK